MESFSLSLVVLCKFWKMSRLLNIKLPPSFFLTNKLKSFARESASFNLRTQENQVGWSSSPELWKTRPSSSMWDLKASYIFQTWSQIQMCRTLNFSSPENTYRLRVPPEDSMKAHLQLLSTKCSQVRTSQQKSKQLLLFQKVGFVCLL